MNRIQAIMARSEHLADDHLVIAVDGVPLDVLLDRAAPEHRSRDDYERCVETFRQSGA